MPSTRNIFAPNLKNAIPLNRVAEMDLPPAVRDLADLLAEIACKQLSTLSPSASPALEKRHD